MLNTVNENRKKESNVLLKTLITKKNGDKKTKCSFGCI